MNLSTNDQAQDLPAGLPWDEEAIVSPANYESAEYNLAVTTTTPSAKTAIDIGSLTESLDVEVVKQEVAAELDAAKESIRVDAVNTTAAESPLLVQMLIDRIAEDGKEHPDLLHFLPYLEGQKEWLLGRADYEDGHARALCHFWQLMLADDGTPGTLALRAKIDIGEVGNYHNAAFVQWWEENIRPWAITHGAMFNPEVITADAEKVLLAASEAVPDIVEESSTLSIGARLTTTTDANGNVRLVNVVGMSVIDAGNGTPDDSANRINALKATFSDLDYDAADSFDSTSMVLVEHDSGALLIAHSAQAQEALVEFGTTINEKYSGTGAYTFSATEGTVTGVDTCAAVEAGDGVVLLEREGCGVLTSMIAMSAVTTAFKDIRESQADAQVDTEVVGGNAVNNNG